MTKENLEIYQEVFPKSQLRRMKVVDEYLNTFGEMIKKKVISTWAIAPRKLSNEVKEFLAENCADYSKYWSDDIPMKAVSRIESGRKVLWENPIFEETKK